MREKKRKRYYYIHKKNSSFYSIFKILTHNDENRFREDFNTIYIFEVKRICETLFFSYQIAQSPKRLVKHDKLVGKDE